MTAVATKTRRCSLCRELKPHKDFVRNQAKPCKIGYWCRTCHNAASKTRYYKNRDRERFGMRARNKAIRAEVLRAYSDGKTHPECACCGESNTQFLSVDHINGGGNQHRKRIGKNGGSSFMRWLRNQGFPAGFRLLCRNCNFSYGAYGFCPHSVLS